MELVDTKMKRAVTQGFQLREVYTDRVNALKGKERWDFVVKFSSDVRGYTEKAAHASAVQKEVIDKWTDEDFVEMGVTRQALEDELHYTQIIKKMAEIHEGTECRKDRSRERLKLVWGVDWEEDLEEIMPPWAAEEFLRHLAVFAESKSFDVGEAKEYLEKVIAARVLRPRSRKDKYLMVSDITKDNDKATIERGEKTKEREQIVDREVGHGEDAGDTTIIVASGSTGQPSQNNGRPPVSGANADFPARAFPGGNGSPDSDSEATLDPDTFSITNLNSNPTTSTPGGELSEPDIIASSSRISDRTKSKRKLITQAKEIVDTKKARRWALEPLEVIDLDIDEKVRELEVEGQDEEYKADVAAVKDGIKAIQGMPGKDGEKAQQQVLARRIEMMMRAAMITFVDLE